MKRILLAAMVAASALSHAQILGTTGTAVHLLTPPSTVVTNMNESDTDSIVFYESDSVLASSLLVDGSGPGTYTGASPTSITAGTAVSSYLLHSDRVGTVGSAITYSGSITFGQKILGVIATAPKLTSSAFLQNPATTYDTNGLRDFELSGQEFFIISADEKTLSFQCNVTDTTDQLRIVTEAVPEPASMTVLGAAILGFIARKRKKA